LRKGAVTEQGGPLDWKILCSIFGASIFARPTYCFVKPLRRFNRNFISTKSYQYHQETHHVKMYICDTTIVNQQQLLDDEIRPTNL